MSMDGTENKQDPKASAGGQGTSDKEPETFTVDQVKEREQKAANDALAAAGRTAKALEQREQALKQEREELDQWRKERDEAEIAAAQEDADKLPLVQQRQALRKQEAELRKKETQLEADKLSHQAEIDAAREERRAMAIWDIATKHGIDAAALKERCEGIESMEEVEKIAKDRASAKPPPPPPTPDSGRTSGGGEKSEEQKLKERFPTMNK